MPLAESQQKIQSLEAELAQMKKILQQKTAEQTTPAGLPTGLDRAKHMGLVPQHVHDTTVPTTSGRNITPAELKKLQSQAGGSKLDGVLPTSTDTEDQGKENNPVTICAGCSTCREKDKVVKSGKYVKSNIKIKQQQQWPHINVLRKYVKRPAFDAMEFEAFIAGETRIILSMEDPEEARGRLSLLCKLAHWYCKCKDWPAI